jgi:phosphoribosyl-ATP pyrophosphohydrolase/phosphoribosyl-AMP cyclohydrolase
MTKAGNGFDPSTIDFEKGGGLVPAIVQDDLTRQVLMLGYMNKAALAETIDSGEVTFFSRSRQAIWRKGAVSGARLKLVSIETDCDADTLLVIAEPLGPTCHRGTASCFGAQSALGAGQLGALARTIAARASAGAKESYTGRLLAEGVKRCAQKLGEEGVETALAGAAGDANELREESADLLYHLLVLWRARGVELHEVMDVLARRAADRGKAAAP